jgi:hypothetical protein
MKNTQQKREKQYAKVVLIIFCVFAVIASFLIIVSIYGVPQALEYRQETKYLYENGVEVDAYIKRYYDDYGLVGSHSDPARVYKGRFHIVYEYVDDNGNMYTDEYLVTVICRSRDELRAREQYIKQIVVSDGTTMKMLVADNGLCCLSVYKESLLKPTTLGIYIIIISVSSVVLGLSIFGIVRQSRALRRLANKNININ